MSTSLFPDGGWDVHHYIFEPSRFPYDPNRHLTPPPATTKEYTDFKLKTGLTNSVLTHGRSYGADSTCLHTFTQDLDPSTTRSIALIDPETITPTELADLHKNGVCGIRVNMYRYNAMHDVELQKLALTSHSRALGGHVIVWGGGSSMLSDDSGTGVPEDGDGDVKVTKQAGFDDILDLVRSGHLFVKISAPYRVSTQAPYFQDLKPLARALFDANPQQILWGSDWPHTPLMKVRKKYEAFKKTPYLEVDDMAWLRSLRSWLSDQEWKTLMVENPQRLYDW
ncbi:unnamed protein product [Penicillium pancosmium]